MFSIKLEKFEGPLSLLLHLIEKEKLAINQVSLAKVTDEFLLYVKNSEVPSWELADFLEIAAQLVWLKSKYLLPEFIGEEEERGESLVEKLKIYQAYKQAGKEINRLNHYPYFSLNRTNLPEEIWRKIDFSFKITPSILEKEIKRLFLSLETFHKKRIFKMRLKAISFKKKMEEILSYINKNKELVLNKFFSQKPKEEIIVLVLVILELNKKRVISLEQKKLFSPIYVRKE